MNFAVVGLAPQWLNTCPTFFHGVKPEKIREVVKTEGIFGEPGVWWFKLGVAKKLSRMGDDVQNIEQPVGGAAVMYVASFVFICDRFGIVRTLKYAPLRTFKVHDIHPDSELFPPEEEGKVHPPDIMFSEPIRTLHPANGRIWVV